MTNYLIGPLSIQVIGRTPELDEEARERLRSGHFFWEAYDTRWIVNGIEELVPWPKRSICLSALIKLPDEVQVERSRRYVFNSFPEGRELVEVAGFVYAPELLDPFFGREVAEYIRANRVKPYPVPLR